MAGIAEADAEMNANLLAKELSELVALHGEDLEILLQDSPNGANPELCKHEHFFIVEEVYTESNKIEIVLRTWPY